MTVDDEPLIIVRAEDEHEAVGMGVIVRGGDPRDPGALAGLAARAPADAERAQWDESAGLFAAGSHGDLAAIPLRPQHRPRFYERPQACMTDVDVYRSANQLLKQYGPGDASSVASRRAAALTEQGDIAGQRAWQKVASAIEELTRGARRPGEPLN